MPYTIIGIFWREVPCQMHDLNYFASVSDLSFCSLNSVFQRVDIFNFDEVLFIVYIHVSAAVLFSFWDFKY